MKTDTTLPSRDLQSWNRQKTNAHTDNHRLRPEIIRNRIGTVLVHTGESWKGPSRPAGMYQVTLGRGFPRRQKGMCKGPKVSLWLGTTILPWHRPWGRGHHTYFTEVSPERLRLRVSKLLRDKAIPSWFQRPSCPQWAMPCSVCERAFKANTLTGFLILWIPQECLRGNFVNVLLFPSSTSG